MTSAVDAMKRAAFSGTWIFRGTMHSGASVAWGRAPCKTSTGMVEGRVIGFGAIRNGAPEVVGGIPERASASMVLDNADAGLNRLLTGGDSLLTEYLGDGFHNLRGRIYGVVRDDATGELLEVAVTPELCVVGEIVIDDGVRVTVQLASVDDRVVGRSQYRVTVAQIAAAEILDLGRIIASDGTVLDPAFVNFQGQQSTGLTEGRDDVVPFVFGNGPIPVAKRNDPEDSNHFEGLAFLSRHEPNIDDVTAWQVFGEASNDRTRSGYYLYKVPLRVDVEPGRTEDLWVVGLRVSGRHQEKHHLIPPDTNAVSAAPGRTTCPADVIRSIAEELSEAHEDGIDAASFERSLRACKHRGLVFVVAQGEGTIGELCSQVAEPLGWLLSLGIDGRLVLLPAGGMSPADYEAAAGTLPHLRYNVDLHSFSERVRLNPPAPGAAATRTVVSWSSEQEEFWGKSQLAQWAPSAATIPLPEEREITVSGACLSPQNAAVALATGSARRGYVARRYRGHVPAWIAALPKGSLLRISHPRALGGGGDAGVTMRLARLEYTELQPGEFSALATFEDLGQIENLRLAILDSIERWVALIPGGGGPSLTLAAGSDLATCSANVFNSGHLGCSLQTFGAAHAENRKSRKIVEVVAANKVRVAYPYTASETIAASGAGTATIDQAWIVMYNRSAPPPDPRLDRFCVCVEATGKFTNGDDGFQLISA